MRLDRNQIGGLVFAVLGAIGLWAAWGLPFGNARLPGPGAMPIVLSGALVILSLALLFADRTVAPEDASAVDMPDKWGELRIGATALLIMVYIAAIGLLGFFLDTFLLTFAMFMLGAPGFRILWPAIGGLASTVVAYGLFVFMLGVPLPAGSIWGG